LSKSQIKSQILRWLEEADQMLEKGDTVQASEKYYKAAEEAVKLLAKTLKLTSVLNKAEQRKTWSTTILFEAASEVEPPFYTLWKDAWYLHIYGFHEMKLESEEVKRFLKGFTKSKTTCKSSI